MSETPTDDTPRPEGQRFLWTRPEALTREAHGDLGLNTVATPYAFTAHCRAIPLTTTEFRAAQAHYPIVFTEGETTLPIAAVGITDDRNLFVDADGNWDEPVYVPAYVRTHPFTFARAAGDQLALVIDRDAATIGSTPEVPFFENDQINPALGERVEFSRVYNIETQRTQAFCSRLVELDLLVYQSMRKEGSEEDLVRFRAVDTDALSQLNAETIDGLFRDGTLAAIYAHLSSLDRWGDLLRRGDDD